MKRRKMAKFTMPIHLEERVVIYDMRSNNTTEFKVYENAGQLSIEFSAPSAVRVVKDDV
ncbi:MAG TPA: hypothetical protein VMW72_21520 [Sedimentisphaerales bacterium]|nr:hypothetical protein [Sedimentisphaerales bacterium]